MFNAPIFAFQTPPPTKTPLIFDSSEVTDTVSVSRGRDVVATESLVLTDLGSTGTVKVILVTDSVSSTDMSTLPLVPVVNDTAIALTDSIAKDFSIGRIVSDTLSTTDQTSANGIVSVLTFDSPIAITDTGYPDWIRHLATFSGTGQQVIVDFDADTNVTSGFDWFGTHGNLGGYGSVWYDLNGAAQQVSDGNGSFYVAFDGTYTLTSVGGGTDIYNIFMGPNGLQYWSCALLFRAASSQNANLFSIGTYWGININQGGGGVQIFQKSGGVTKTLTMTLEPTTWQLLIATYDGTNLSAKISTAASIVTGSIASGNVDTPSPNSLYFGMGGSIHTDVRAFYVSDSTSPTNSAFPDYTELASYMNHRYKLTLREF